MCMYRCTCTAAAAVVHLGLGLEAARGRQRACDYVTQFDGMRGLQLRAAVHGHPAVFYAALDFRTAGFLQLRAEVRIQPHFAL